MDIDNQIELEHILFLERKCRSCGDLKNLLDDFYLIRKNRGVYPSSYSYECKECTKKRVIKSRKRKLSLENSYWNYPDW